MTEVLGQFAKGMGHRLPRHREIAGHGAGLFLVFGIMKPLTMCCLVLVAMSFNAAATVPSFAHELEDLDKAKAEAAKKDKPITFVFT